MENVFNLTLINNNSASEHSINDALISVGYPMPLPLQTLETIFMTLYFKTVGTRKSNRAPINVIEENVYNVQKSVSSGHRRTQTIINIYDESVYKIQKNLSSGHRRTQTIINLYDESV